MPGSTSRALFGLALAVATLHCGPPTCPPPTVKLGAPATLTTTSTSFASVVALVNDTPTEVLLDTGYDRSALSADAADGKRLQAITVKLGDALLGPSSFDLLLSPLTSSVVGNDLLHQLPLVFDPAAHSIDLRSQFGAANPGSAHLTFISANACHDDDAKQGARGPFEFTLPADIEGNTRTFILDTGSDVTMVRRAFLDSFTARNKLGAIRLGTGFAGSIFATALRTKTFTVGDQTSTNLALYAAPEIDAELDARQKALRDACHCDVKIDGFLGFNFLREYRVSLAEGQNAITDRALGLTRLDTQAHWSREFIGVGAYFSADPNGLKVDSFLSRSPLKDAGVQVGDVLTAVDGKPSANAPVPFAPAGTTVAIAYTHAGTPGSVNVTVTDLLPDP